MTMTTSFADDGMEREESGHPGAVEGGYSYTSPEGELVSYIWPDTKKLDTTSAEFHNVTDIADISV